MPYVINSLLRPGCVATECTSGTKSLHGLHCYSLPLTLLQWPQVQKSLTVMCVGLRPEDAHLGVPENQVTAEERRSGARVIPERDRWKWVIGHRIGIKAR